ncbi:MAG: Lys-gingipain W83 precursor [Candidatus Cloacimonetes bacterium ADurb.Bin211]|nr:MAG: Lys-gingipain W83 precursor [Candidatus Cloacimonetes bacterium ADurb.Bin211]
MTHSTTYYYEGSRSFRFSSFSSGSPYDQYLITPQLVVNSGDQTVSFYYRRYSSYTSETFRVGWSSTGTEIDNFTWSSDITNASTTWQQYSKNDLPVGTKYVAVHYKSNFAYYLYIDQFVGPEKWTSPTPPNPAINPDPVDGATNVQKYVTLSWSSGGGSPTDYKIFWGTSETSFENEQSGLTTTSFSPTNLQYSTTYYWKVDPHNNYGYASSITPLPIWSFTTMADPTITEFPHTENFDGTAFPPVGWTHQIGSGDTGWQRSTGSSNPTVSPYSGAGMLYYNSYSLYNGSNASLFSPPINAGNADMVYSTSFWMYRYKGYSSYADKV